MSSCARLTSLKSLMTPGWLERPAVTDLWLAYQRLTLVKMKAQFDVVGADERRELELVCNMIRSELDTVLALVEGLAISDGELAELIGSRPAGQ